VPYSGKTVIKNKKTESDLEAGSIHLLPRHLSQPVYRLFGVSYKWLKKKYNSEEKSTQIRK
jgi:hypothetical protein